MNLRDHHVALIVGGLGVALFLLWLVLAGGCAAGLPPEPPFVETVAATSVGDH